MLVVSDDNLSSTSVYGAKVGGRLKSSQFYTYTADTRAPVNPGLYLGNDSTNTAYLKINKGAGSGGFAFQTHGSTGALEKTHMELSEYGYVTMPLYSATTDGIDQEPTAIASFDPQGKLVRNYQQNTRLRSVENRVASAEEDAFINTPNAVNSIIKRLNSLEFFSTPIAELAKITPPSGYSTPSSEVQVSVNTTLSTAQSPSWQTSFIQAISDTTSTPVSSISIASVSSSPLLTARKGASSSTPGIFVVVRISPSSRVDPKTVVNMISDQAKDPASKLSTNMTTRIGSNPVDTTYTPKTRDIATDTLPTPAPPSILSARYIKFQYGNGFNGNPRGLNMGGLKAYSSSTGNNIITPTMTTSSLDVLPGYPSSNLVDADDGTFYHAVGTSEYPWVQVDLGADTPLYKIVLRNRMDCCRGRIAGLTMTLISSNNNVVYTSGMAALSNGSVVYVGSNTVGYDFYSYWPALSNTPYGSNGSPSGSPTPAPSGQTIIRNYLDSDPIQQIFNQLFFFWTAPVNCRITSLNIFGSGGLNNGGYVVLKVFKGNWQQIYASGYMISIVQDNEISIPAWSTNTLAVGEQLIIQWSTMETFRYFSTHKNATNDLPVIMTYEPI